MFAADAADQVPFPTRSPAEKVRAAAGPVVFRILPHEFKAKASSEGLNGKRALQRRTGRSSLLVLFFIG